MSEQEYIDAYYEEFGEYPDEIPEFIYTEVEEYKKKSNKSLNKLKLLFFAGILAGVGYEIYKNQVKSNLDSLQEELDAMEQEGLEEIDKRIDFEKSYTNKELSDFLKNFYKDNLEITTGRKDEYDKFYRVITNYYKRTEGTYEKWGQDKDYLKEQVTLYDKMERVVAYYNKDGTIRAYFSLDDYESMVYNTNLTNEAWRETLRYLNDNDLDLVYVPVHTYSCPHCQKWQGKILSVSGENKNYPSLEEALEDGLKHPNCKHVLTIYNGQEETDKFSSKEWEEKYKTRQQINSIDKRIERLKTDLEVYTKLEDDTAIEEAKTKIKELRKQIREKRGNL